MNEELKEIHKVKRLTSMSIMAKKRLERDKRQIANQKPIDKVYKLAAKAYPSSTTVGGVVMEE
jgi:hypothetical protein